MPYTSKHVSKRTKIIATISDYRCNHEFIKRLYDEGMNIVRFNTAHISPDSATEMLETVREVSDNIPVMIDTKGPEIRITNVEKEFKFEEGDEIKFAGGVDKISSRECVYVNYNNFAEELKVGNSVLIDDGELGFEVISKKDNYVICKAGNGGTLKGRKSVNVPGVSIQLPSLSEKDRKFIQWSIDNDVDFIAHSFVRNKKDVLDIQDILDAQNSKIKIIAKIENQIGVDNLDEILDHAYGIMIARGDLGIEVDAEKIPSIQKSMIKKCKKRRKPVIVATQMLHTMIENPRPTRAEVSDVANAVFSRTDCIMLSGETAYGKYPTEAVRTMTSIALEIEKEQKFDTKYASLSVDNQIPSYLAKIAVQAIPELNLKSIISDTFTGRTVLYLASFRPGKPIFGICYSNRLKRELMLSYGVFAYKIDRYKTSDEFKASALKLLIDDKIIDQDDLVLIMGGNFNPKTGVSFIDISNAKTLLENIK